MQDCFREYPEIYGSEIEDDEAASAEEDAAAAGSQQLDSTPSKDASESDHPKAKEERAQGATEQVKQQHSDAEKQYSGDAKVGKALGADVSDAREGPKTAEPVNHSEVIPKAAYDQTKENAKVEKK